jgi:hypothetical protein
MEVPLNLLHDYIGLPVLTFLTVDNIIHYKKNPSLTKYHFGFMYFYATLTTAAFGLPVLFTHDPLILSFGTFAGDCFVGAVMALGWLVSIRAFLGNKPRVAVFAKLLVFLLLTAICVESAHRGLNPPYGATVAYNTSGDISVVYADTLAYTVLNALNSLSFLFIGIYFWMQGKTAPTSGVRLRIRGFAIGLMTIALTFFLTPTISSSDKPKSSAVFAFSFFTLGYLIIGITALAGKLIDKKKPNSIKGV